MKLGEAYLRMENMSSDLQEIEDLIPHLSSEALENALETAAGIIQGKGALEKKIAESEFESLVEDVSSIVDLKTTITVLEDKISLYKKILLRPNLGKTKYRIKEEVNICESALYKIKETISKVSWEIDIGP